MPSADELNQALADVPPGEDSWLRFSSRWSSPVVPQLVDQIAEQLGNLGFATVYDVRANGDELVIVAQVTAIPALFVLPLVLAGLVILGLALVSWRLESLSSDPRAGALVWTAGTIAVAVVAALGLYWFIARETRGGQIVTVPFGPARRRRA